MHNLRNNINLTAGLNLTQNQYNKHEIKIKISKIDSRSNDIGKEKRNHLQYNNLFIQRADRGMKSNLAIQNSELETATLIFKDSAKGDRSRSRRAFIVNNRLS